MSPEFPPCPSSMCEFVVLSQDSARAAGLAHALMKHSSQTCHRDPLTPTCMQSGGSLAGTCLGNSPLEQIPWELCPAPGQRTRSLPSASKSQMSCLTRKGASSPRRFMITVGGGVDGGERRPVISVCPPPAHVNFI